MTSKWKILAEFMKGYRLPYFGAIAVMFVAIVATYGVPLIVGVTIDHLIRGQEIRAGQFVKDIVTLLGARSVLSHNLWVMALAIVLLSSFAGVFMYFRARWSAVASEAIGRRIRDRLYDHLQHLTCTYHDKAPTGDLVQRCTSDVETVRGFLSVQLVEIGRAIILLLVVVPIMAAVSVRMTLVAMSLVPLILLFALLFFWRVKSAFKLSDEAEGAMTTVLQENLTGIRVVRAFARQDYECDKFAAKNADYRDKTFRMVRLMAWYWSSSDFLCHALNALVLVVGAWWITTGQITVGTLVIFTSYLSMMLWPIRQMGRILTDLGKAMVSLGRISEILQEPREAAPVAPAEPVADGLAVRGQVSFRNLTFSFDGKTPVLHDVSFEAAPGMTLAIMGPSGGGKSALMHLLLRLYDYQQGSIQVDGRELRDLDRQYIRSQIGSVMQEPFLYSKTLRDNIRIGGRDVGDEDIIQAASVACVHDSIVKFEKGYDTLVGERGVTLSGGQRQRVALARAILRDPPILILDDALSAVDTHTESMILDSLKSRHGRRTTLVIAHRLSTLMQADRIIVLEAGRIVQSGTHEELVSQDGLYGRLWRIQSSLEEDLDRQMQTV